LEFNVADQALIAAYLANPANDYVLIRVSLSGTDIPPTAEIPVLCKDIIGSEATGVDLPWQDDTVALDEIGVEVSDVNGVGGTADVTAYVYGEEGNQYFEIYITDMEVPAVGVPNWIKIGLYNELTDPEDNSTAICAAVTDFGGLSKLTVSIDNTPSDLSTTTSDNQIGHFLISDVDLLDCSKATGALPGCSTDSSIETCEFQGISTSGGQEVEESANCNNNQFCMLSKGDFPADTDIQIVIRTNGATDDASTQDGIYLRSIRLYNEESELDSGDFDITYYDKDGEEIDLDDYEDGVYPPNYPGDCYLDEEGDFKFVEAVKAVISVNTQQLGGGEQFQYCVRYFYDLDELDAGDTVKVWAMAETLPCGSLFDDMLVMATVFDCEESLDQCIYFPYVLTGSSPWMAGIAITNMDSVDASDMVAEMILTDATGAEFTYTKDDFTGVITAFFVDSILSEFDGTPAPGPAMLKVRTNFDIDGYSFLTDGTFGAGTLSRSCCYDSSCD
jgi:hypothetical protein